MTSCESPLRSVTAWQSRTLFCVVLALLGGSLISWVKFDRAAVSWLLHSNIDPDANFWVEAFTRLGKAWLQIWLLLIWFAFSRRRREVLAGILALMIVGAAVSPLKVAVGRVRPYSIVKAQEAGQPEHDTGNHLSFPSGDTAAAFAVAGAIAPTLGWPLRLALLGSSAILGGLRVTALAHYPSDVLAGAAMGLLAGWLAVRLIDRWGHAVRPVPFEKGFMWGGIIGLPIATGISKGFGELLLFLGVYGLLILCAFLLVGLRDLWRRTGPAVLVPFLARTRHIAVSVAVAGVIVENVVNGKKPHELLSLDEPPSPWAGVGFSLVVVGALVRLRPQDRIDQGLKSSGRLTILNWCGRHVGSFLVVCGLLTQLRGWANWLVVMPLFILFYGASFVWRGHLLPPNSVQSREGDGIHRSAPDPSLRFQVLSHLRDLRHTCLSEDYRRLWATLALICLPLTLELFVEDFVCEGLLRMH